MCNAIGSCCPAFTCTFEIFLVICLMRVGDCNRFLLLVKSLAVASALKCSVPVPRCPQAGWATGPLLRVGGAGLKGTPPLICSAVSEQDQQGPRALVLGGRA